MDFGLLLGTQFDDPRSLDAVGDELVRQTELARTAGFDSVSISEHHVTEDQYLYNEAVMGHLAEHVGSMSLCSTLVLLPYHNPVRIAEFGATLDALTGGNFQLGVGLGYRDTEYEAFGITRSEAPGRLIEGVDIIKRLWTDDSVSYDGKYFQLEDVSIRPKPVQSPRPPIWVGASNESSIRRGARIGDAFLGAHVPFDVAEEQVEYFRDERAAVGTDRGAVGFLREAFVAREAGRAESIVRDPLLEKYERYVDWGQDDVIDSDDFDRAWETLRRDRFLVGTPEEVRSAIERYRSELDLDRLVLRMQFPSSDVDDVRDSIRLFGDAVIPHFQ